MVGVENNFKATLASKKGPSPSAEATLVARGRLDAEGLCLVIFGTRG